MPDAAKPLQMPEFLGGPDQPTGPELATLVDHLLATVEAGTPLAQAVAEAVKADRTEVAEGREAFAVTDLDSAEWAMGRRTAHAIERAALVEQRKRYVERIGQWFDQATRAIDASDAYLDGHLVAFAAEYRAQDPKHHKTLVLPSGKVRSSEAKPKVAVADDEALADWLGENATPQQYDALVKITPKVYVDPLRKLAQVMDLPIPAEERAQALVDNHGMDYDKALAETQALDDADPKGIPTRPTVVFPVFGRETPVDPEAQAGARWVPIPTGVELTPHEVTFTVSPDVKG